MIKQIKNLMLIAVAAMGFASCQNEGIEEVTRPQEVVMTITAEADETRTAIDETNKTVKWSAGDQLKVIENSATYRTTTAINIDGDGKATFTVAFPANTSATSFTYNAIFPATAVTEDDGDKINNAKVKVTVKDQQMATATSFDPTADVLVSKHIETEAQPTELNMQFKRLVALGKMTLNNLPADAKIERVIFTATEGKGLAGRNYVDATKGEVSQYCYYGKSNTLTISYDEPISTRDIYFTCNPFEMEAGETFKVKAVCGTKSYTREVEIPADRTLKFTEGDLSTFSVDMRNATVETNSVFAEGQYVVIAKSGSNYYAMKGVMGSGNYMTYTQVTYDGTANNFTTDDDTIVWTIAAADGGFTLQNYEGKYLYGSSSGNYAYLGDAQTLTITPVDGTTQQYYIAVKSISERILGFNTNSGQERFAFYKGTQANKLYLVPVGENTDPYFTINQDLEGYTADGDEIEFEVIRHNDFNAEVTATTDVEWISIVHNGDMIYATAEPNEGAARSATITFSAEGYKSVEVTVNQEAGENAGEDDGDDTITVADFLDKADTSTEYKLTGKITNVANTTYGNFDLTDATGTVYVYGLLTPEGASQQQWAAAGLKQGDIITIKGKYNVYNNSPQIKNAVYVSHKGINVNQSTLSFGAEGGSLDVTATLVNATDAISASVDNSHFTVTLKSGTTYTITAPANETEENIYGNLTFTAGELSVVVAIAQEAKVVAGEVAGGRDDFNTVAANNSYAKRTSTNGWVGENCAVMQGGTSDSNPTFKFIGSTAATRAFTMNGKTSAKGTITSPTLTTGCGKLSLKYGHAFSESNGVDFTITIKQNGTTVNSYKVDVNSISQKTVYTWEQDVNVAGDFVIEITNNSPSNSSSNKDRVSIWDIEWTGYNN